MGPPTTRRFPWWEVVVSFWACPARQRRLRYASAYRAACRIAGAPAGLRAKQRLLAPAPLPRLAPGLEFRKCGRHNQDNFRSAFMKSLRVKGQLDRSPAVILTLINKGHRLDPAQIAQAQPLTIARRLFTCPGAQRMMHRAKACWDIAKDRATHVVTYRRTLKDGLICRVEATVEELG